MTEIRQTEDLGGPVIQPDTVLPSQFFAVLREKGFVEGEKRLMAAVMADAVDVYQKMAFSTEARGQQLFHDAEEWIFGEGGPRSFFSFENICDVLSLEPEYIRHGLLEWRRRRTATIRPKDAFRREPQAHRPADARRSQSLKKAVG